MTGPRSSLPNRRSPQVKVAVPVFRGCVSPVFDWAQLLVVVDYDGNKETSRREEDIGDLAPWFRPGRLVALGVGALLCGGISQALMEMLLLRGILVTAGLVGETDALLAAYFAGRLPAPEFAMPGSGFGPSSLPRMRGGRWRHGWGPGRMRGR